MRSFKDAHLFMAEKTSLEIFYEILPYVIAAEDRGTRFGHDIAAILVAAFGGKYTPSVFNDPAIRDLLEMCNWGWENLGSASVRWGEKYAKTPADQSFYSLICNLIATKSDEVHEYLNENARTGFALRPGRQLG